MYFAKGRSAEDINYLIEKYGYIPIIEKESNFLARETTVFSDHIKGIVGLWLDKPDNFDIHAFVRIENNKAYDMRLSDQELHWLSDQGYYLDRCRIWANRPKQET